MNEMERCVRCGESFAHQCDDRRHRIERPSWIAPPGKECGEQCEHDNGCYYDDGDLSQAVAGGPLLSQGTFYWFKSLGGFPGISLEEAIARGDVVSDEWEAEHSEADLK